MLRALLHSLKNTRPAVIIGAIQLLKAIGLLAILPGFQQAIAPFYGINFTDNYEMLGWNLSIGNGYRFMPDTALTLMREPGYPLVLAGLFSVFGYGISIARAANLIFSFFSAILLSNLTRRVTGSEAAARIAPVIFLLHPGFMLAEARGGVESLFIMLLLCFFTLLYRALQSGRLKDYLYAGLVLGLSANVRSTALLFPAFLFVYFFFWEQKRPSIVTMVSRVATVVLAAFLVLSPWIVRNYALVGKFVPAASVAGVSAYAGYHICTHLNFDNNLEQVDAEAGDVRGALARQQGFRFKESNNLYYLYFYDPHDELAFNSFLGERVVENYLATPSLIFTCPAKNFFHFWFSGKSWPVTALNALVQLPYLILAGIGLFMALRRGDPRLALLAPMLLFIIYTLGVYLPILAQARYSIHLIPFLSLLAAIPLTRWLYDRQGTEPSSLVSAQAAR